MTQEQFQTAYDMHRELMVEDQLHQIGRAEDIMVNFQTYLLEWMR